MRLSASFSHTADTLDDLMRWVNGLQGSTPRDLALTHQLPLGDERADMTITGVLDVDHQIVNGVLPDDDLWWYVVVLVTFYHAAPYLVTRLEEGAPA